MSRLPCCHAYVGALPRLCLACHAWGLCHTRPSEEAAASKPAYLREMERYRALSCAADTKHDRPLVK